MHRTDRIELEEALDFGEVSAEDRLWENTYRLRLGLAILLGLFFVAYLWRSMFISVTTGHAAVLWSRFGGGVVTAQTYGEGMHVIYPWDRMDIYDVRVQEK